MTTEAPQRPPALQAALDAHRDASAAFRTHLDHCGGCFDGRFCHAMWRLDLNCDAAAYRLGQETRR